MNPQRIIVVGAGQAGMQLTESLRRGGYEGELVLIGEEPFLPYQRPPLSKKYLTGELEDERLSFRPQAHYDKLGIRLLLGQRVVGIDRPQQEIVLASGERMAYGGLALTTGTRVRHLPTPGAEDPRVHYLRGLADAQAIKQRLAGSARLVVIGGGFIGLEVAAVARTLDKTVTVLETQDRLLARVVAPVVSEYYHALHTSRGVRIHTGVQVAGLVPAAGDALAVELGNGGRLEAELVVVGIGVVPNVELASAAGLSCDNGILVDEFAQTSDPNIVAAGDCTMHHNMLFEQRLRLESVQNAVDQAKVAAATLLGQPSAYAQVPWFWSDQYEVKLQIAGISQGYDRVVLRGDPATHAFSACYFRGAHLLCADSINKPADHMLVRRLLAAKAWVPPEKIADPTVDLKTLVATDG